LGAGRFVGLGRWSERQNTCADGYSNNYRLHYKHTFREIIRKELDKDPHVSYYEVWIYKIQ